MCYNEVNDNYRGDGMELGQRLKEARLAAGFSQRQLCGDVITRNMLSQIENGGARPSMDTLRYLAGRLEKPVSYFLDEEIPASPNQSAMEAARLAWLMKDPAETLKALEDYREPDELFDRERELLEALACLDLAEQALDRGYRPRAAELLARAAEKNPAYCGKELERRRLLLLARLEPTGAALPSLDEELMIRARVALESGDSGRSGALLDAVENRDSARWNLLRGDVYLEEKNYEAAANCFRAAEDEWPEKTASRLETCYRELGDFKLAYEYACRLRKVK